MKIKKSTAQLCRAALISALYVLLTFLSSLAGLSSGAVQFRLSEALCVLPVFTPAAIPGLTVGCLIANILTGAPVWDVIFGTAATCLGALGAWGLRRVKYISPLPTVAANTLIIPVVIKYAYGVEKGLLPIALGVGAGEIVCAWMLGVFLIVSLRPIAKKIL